VPVGVIGGLVVVCLLAVAIMAITGACPPQGPWPVPPWCGAPQVGEVEMICPPPGPWPMPPGCETPPGPEEAQPPGEAVEPPMDIPPDQVGVPTGEPIFHDDFEGDRLKEGWQFLNGPGDLWEVREHQLMFAVMPGSTIAERGQSELRAPALVFPLPDPLRAFSAQVSLRFVPHQNGQGAGLIILTERQNPVFSLTRSLCDKPEVCRGDAIYLDDWLKAAEVVEYRPAIVEVGELPPEAGIMLRIDVQPGLLIAFVRSGEGEWRVVGEWPMVAARVGSVGLVTTAGGQDVERNKAAFDDFVVLPMDR
jgi:hypothetical protein